MTSIYRLFRRFLKERDCEDAFDKAFTEQHPGYVLDACLWEIIGGDEFFLGRAFDWSLTREGRDYWKAMDQKWYNLLTDLQI